MESSDYRPLEPEALRPPNSLRRQPRQGSESTTPLWKQRKRLQWKGQNGVEQRRCPNYELRQTR